MSVLSIVSFYSYLGCKDKVFILGSIPLLTLYLKSLGETGIRHDVDERNSVFRELLVSTSRPSLYYGCSDFRPSSHVSPLRTK